MRILYVEDHQDTVRITARVLRQEGHEVTPVGSGAEARSAWAADAFDLLICDLSLPDCDGWDLMRELRAASPNILAIAISVRSYEEDHAMSAEAGFDLHLDKPVTLEALRDAVRKMALLHKLAEAMPVEN
jgi:CheY-like chemotaxis protein